MEFRSGLPVMTNAFPLGHLIIVIISFFTEITFNHSAHNGEKFHY